MDIFDVLSLIGGLCLFLLGMNLMSSYLEKRAGGRLKGILSHLTNNPVKGFLLGLGVTSVIQSSSATTVMLVGLVSAGVMSLKQAISIIMGANVGTTVTAWILSLTGIESDNMWINMLKPSSFTPILALIGIILLMMCKSNKKKDTGMILLGFAVLMYGMDSMSAAVSGLKDVPEFSQFLLAFSNPLLGILAGAILTGIIQSSSASVGILQALSSTGAITYGVALPIIMGQNIGTCVTALISSIGTSREAKRAAMVHLYFNVCGVVIIFGGFSILNAIFDFGFMDMRINEMGIAVIHTAFNVIGTAIMLPCRGLLEKLACLTVKDSKENDEFRQLNDSLLQTPALAVSRCKSVAFTMADKSANIVKKSFSMLNNYDEKTAQSIRKGEEDVDVYEDRIGTYLVKVSSKELTDEDSHEVTKLLRLIGDFERISDHAVNLLESAEEIHDKRLQFSEEDKREIGVLSSAVSEIVDLAIGAFDKDDLDMAMRVEPLEQVVDHLKEQIKLNHILRLQKSESSMEHGFVLADVLTNLERVADHCSNIAGCMIEMSQHEALDMHRYLGAIKSDGEDFERKYKEYRRKYSI